MGHISSRPDDKFVRALHDDGRPGNDFRQYQLLGGTDCGNRNYERQRCERDWLHGTGRLPFRLQLPAFDRQGISSKILEAGWE